MRTTKEIEHIVLFLEKHNLLYDFLQVLMVLTIFTINQGWQIAFNSSANSYKWFKPASRPVMHSEPKTGHRTDTVSTAVCHGSRRDKQG